MAVTCCLNINQSFILHNIYYSINDNGSSIEGEHVFKFYVIKRISYLISDQGFVVNGVFVKEELTVLHLLWPNVLVARKFRLLCANYKTLVVSKNVYQGTRV